MHLLAEIRLCGEAAVPWSPPRTIQGGKPGGKRNWVHFKDKRLIAWQDSLRAAHRKVYGRDPHLGPVMLTMVFVKGTADRTLWGTPCWHRGQADITNLAKGAEDAITTFRQHSGKLPHRILVFEIPGVIENDCQTTDTFLRKRWGPQDGIEIKVYALDTEDD